MNSKILLVLTFLMTLFYCANSQENRLLYGDKKAMYNVRISPSIDWAIIPQKGYLSAPNMGVKVSFATDFRISRSCFISAGLQYSYSKIGILNTTNKIEGGNAASYLGIPLAFKVKSSPQNRSRFYGEFGFDMGVLVASDYWIPKAKKWINEGYHAVSLKPDQLTRVRFGGLIGAGYEYYLSPNLGLQFGVLYHAGFTDVLKSSQSGATTAKPQSFDIVIGLLF